MAEIAQPVGQVAAVILEHRDDRFTPAGHALASSIRPVVARF